MKSIPKSNIEGNVTTKECTKGISTSCIPFYPLKDKVIVKAVFEETALAVKEEKSILRSNPKHTIIVGVGNEVDDLKIGDHVHVSFNASIEPIIFKGNEQSVKAKINLLKDIITNTATAKISMIEYYVVPSYSINGIITEFDESK